MRASATTRQDAFRVRLGRCGAITALGTVLLAGACSSPPRSVPVNVNPSGGPSSGAPASELGPVTPGKSSNGRTVLISVKGDLQRSYRVHVPLTAPEGPRPLVVVLHGRGSRPQTLQYTTGLDNVADRLGLYIAYPEAVGGYWNDGRKKTVKGSGGVDDVDFLEEVMRDMEARHPIDANRVFVVGHGDGGIMASCFAAARPKLVAGIALVSSLLGDATTCKPPTKPISVMLVHGTADPLFPLAGSIEDGLQPFSTTVNYFRMLNKLSGSGKQRKMPDRDPKDGTRVTRTVWGDPKHRVLIVYTVLHGGYPWPGGESSSRGLARLGRTSRDLDTSAAIGHFALDVRPPVK